jgi:hypothetical protein
VGVGAGKTNQPRYGNRNRGTVTGLNAPEQSGQVADSD